MEKHAICMNSSVNMHTIFENASFHLQFTRMSHFSCALSIINIILDVFILLDVGPQTVSSCDPESITIKDPVSGSVQCQDCRNCPAGEGLSVNCGDEISSSTPVVCKPCVLGETYSSAYEAGACKDCENCGPYRETTKECTLTSKAECGKCKVGAYMEPMLSMCKPCSQCCNDGKDIVISQCQVPGVPASKQCSFARSGMCSKMVTTASVSKVSPTMKTNHSTVQSTIPSTVTNTVVTSIPSKPITALPVDASKSQINVIVGSVIGGVFVVLILPLAIVIRFVMVKRRKTRKQVNDLPLAETAPGERPEQVQDNNQQANAGDGNETDRPAPVSDNQEVTTMPVQESGDKSQDKTGTQETKPPGHHGNTGKLTLKLPPTA